MQRNVARRGRGPSRGGEVSGRRPTPHRDPRVVFVPRRAPSPVLTPSQYSVLDIHIDATIDELFAELASTVDDIVTESPVPPQAEANPSFEPAGTEVRCTETSQSSAAPRQQVTTTYTEASQCPVTLAEYPEANHVPATSQEQYHSTEVNTAMDLRVQQEPRSSIRQPQGPEVNHSTVGGSFGIPPVYMSGTFGHQRPQPQKSPVRRNEIPGQDFRRDRGETMRPGPSGNTSYRPAGYDTYGGSSQRASPPSTRPSTRPIRASPGRSVPQENACRHCPVCNHPQPGSSNAQPSRPQVRPFDSFDRSTWPPGLMETAARFRRQANRGETIPRYSYIHSEENIR